VFSPQETDDVIMFAQWFMFYKIPLQAIHVNALILGFHALSNISL